MFEWKRLLEESGNHHKFCFLQITIVMSLVGLDRLDEAIEVATKLVNAAIAATEADPTFISLVTGRGELDPYLMVKVVDTQYSLAVWLFEKAHTWTKKKSLLSSARSHYMCFSKVSLLLPPLLSPRLCMLRQSLDCVGLCRF